ncbi:hypothetical protein D3C72_1250810 [compost metagenome]
MQVVQRLAEQALRQHGMQLLQQHRFDLGQQRLALFGANLLPLFWLHLERVAFDRKQFADALQESCDRVVGTLVLGQGLLCLDQVAARMCPASEVHQLIGVCEVVVWCIAVGHQHRPRLDAGIESCSLLCLACRAIGKQPYRRARAIHLRP